MVHTEIKAGNGPRDDTIIISKHSFRFTVYEKVLLWEL